MAKRISQLTQITAAQLATTDLVPVVDVSAGQTKYATIKDLTGLPDFGWSATGESWSYSSYNSSTKIGVISVPSDATTKYNAGMRVRITQATGGTKTGEIVAVSSTTISVYFNSYTLNNEAITSPQYSSGSAPLGFLPHQKNGNSVRIGNVLICWGVNTVATTGTTVTFAQPYSDIPSVTCALKDVNNQGAWVSAVSSTNTTLKQGYTTSNLIVNWMAIGTAS